MATAARTLRRRVGLSPSPKPDYINSPWRKWPEEAAVAPALPSLSPVGLENRPVWRRRIDRPLASLQTHDWLAEREVLGSNLLHFFGRKAAKVRISVGDAGRSAIFAHRNAQEGPTVPPRYGRAHHFNYLGRLLPSCGDCGLDAAWQVIVIGNGRIAALAGEAGHSVDELLDLAFAERPIVSSQ